ncbi:galactoside 2-alpha-L-fucosyltransferase SEC1-like isoform X2 [Nycticebus coucang]|uniref:galactoside 2-alpha-L-fucosyltransferase SEC1-like isoform X2 n=1 Tax=Nycticebus coucang TaxID=9470 RepID=UPI00234C5832|nr:galactoside 2-alpha-L-fucosyltransferase SEC1-like isoform X2 [Nycticebus coucang]XP_053462425.1 galactoside 2-alpha-L-fucosyltransferase SEC1-like isoform X2 [Nycticebus coucang]
MAMEGLTSSRKSSLNAQAWTAPSVSYPGLESSAQCSLGMCGDPQKDSLARPRMKPTPPWGQGPLPARPPETVLDGRAVAPSSPAAQQTGTDWPRRLKAAIKGFWATCPPLSTVYFLFVIFMVSVIFHCHQRLALVPVPWAYSAGVVLVPAHPAQEGLFTINSKGRLGNQMGQYATLYALAKMNGRPAFILPRMHSTLAPIFRITLPVLHGATARSISWQNYHLNDWMEERYRHIGGDYVRLTGYPCSWTFYHHLRHEILQEFTLHDHVREEAQTFLRALQTKWAWQATFVGVHVRRGDYVRVMPQVWKGVLADQGYLRQAMDWFRARYRTPVFVVTSDDMAWCRESINSSLGDVVFAGNGLQGSPVKDFALLMQCNHSIITVGTFGIWAAYLAGGNTVYLANFTLPDSPFHMVFRPQAAFLPQWVGIAANLKQALQSGH